MRLEKAQYFKEHSQTKGQWHRDAGRQRDAALQERARILCSSWSPLEVWLSYFIYVFYLFLAFPFSQDSLTHLTVEVPTPPPHFFLFSRYTHLSCYYFLVQATLQRVQKWISRKQRILQSGHKNKLTRYSLHQTIHCPFLYLFYFYKSFLPLIYSYFIHSILFFIPLNNSI